MVALAILVLLATALAGAVFPATASAGGGLEVLQVGWDGTTVPGSWSPVRVRVTGDGADSNARVELLLKVRYQPGPQSAFVEHPVGAYGQEVTLPAGVVKEVTIWVPPDTSGMGAVGSVRLIAGSQTVAEEQVEFQTNKTPTRRWWAPSRTLQRCRVS